MTSNRVGWARKLAISIAMVVSAAASPAQVASQVTSPPDATRPNIVLMFPDNLGIGEVSSYGGARGVPTPNIDQIAQQGMRLTNFNVEYSCVVSRIALLTGRYAVRTGEGNVAGMTLWEVTIAEALRSVGYATALFGKWHVGGDEWEGRREPTHQGFDEWWGIPGTSHTAQFTSFEEFDADRFSVPYVWEGKTGQPSRRVTPYDVDSRRTIDRDAAMRGIEFMERNARENKPFFLFYPMTQIHFPALPHPDFAGSTGAGDIGDSMADVDHNVGLMLDAIDRLGIEFMERNARKNKPFFLFYPMTQIHFPALPHPDFAGSTGAGDIGDSMADVDHNVGLMLDAIDRLGIGENTLVLWCTDNGAEMRRPWRGSAGPWRGYYNSATEGGIRTPCVIRWSGRIPPGQVSNDIVHEVDLFPTIAAAVGAPEIVPHDRHIDGVNQLPFLEGLQPNSNRTSAIFLAREGDVMAVKWHDWKLWYSYRTEMPDPNPENLLRLFDLRVDPQEETDVADFYPWVISAMDGIVAEYEASLETYPRVPGGVDDPYVPPARGSGSPVQTYARTDRALLGPRSEALPTPDFSGAWSTTALSSAPPTGRPPPPPVPDLGSGWGDEISVVHDTEQLTVERVIFVPREMQPLVRYRFALDGSETENAVTLGRTGRPPVSTTAWDGNRLVVTTRYPFQDPGNGRWLAHQVTQTLWLQPASGTPFEPSLVVETRRAGALGGPPSTNRTVYNRGYR